jgi:uncharacterized MnhB-related membrane protein
MVYLIVVAGLLVCALQAVRAQRLLLSALWLAGSSALTALLMFLMGAPEVAVIELSVGAGLVTVLFVFAINIAGEESLAVPPVVPRPLAWLLVVGLLLLLGWMNLGLLGTWVGINFTTAFSETVWGERRLDVFLQILLIFAGVLSVLGLMAEAHPSKPGSTPLKSEGQNNGEVSRIEPSQPLANAESIEDISAQVVDVVMDDMKEKIL